MCEAGLMASEQDTIVAMASGPVPAGVAIVRLSGTLAMPVAQAMTSGGLPPARQVSLRRISDPATGELLDKGLVVWFAGPASFTGEDIVELHLHGGPAVVKGVIDAVLGWRSPESDAACRLAQAGEFTKRAFYNERLDLASVEGLADLVRAETAAQRRQALAASSGAARTLLGEWRQHLMHALAMLEASIDFADEDLPPELAAAAAAAVEQVQDGVTSALRDAAAGTALRDGLLVAIVGPPNVGKSSLLNAFVGREAAIVSSIPGTTRDIVEVSLDLGGYPVTIADTAGLREAENVIEREGIARARGLAERADLTLLVLDQQVLGQGSEDIEALRASADLVVLNKADLAGDHGADGLSISVKTGQGLDILRTILLERVRERLGAGEAALITRRRHHDAMLAIHDILAKWSADLEPEVQAHLLHQANRAMSALLGHSDIEDVLDLIFSEFCIGK
jgi:tRNA modification GTPase